MNELQTLFEVVNGRKGADSSSSYTASLFAKGVPAIAQKLGEEAVETIIAAIDGKKMAVIAESADLLYHLLVLWAALGMTPQEVMAELKRREGISGIEEKKSRKGK